jgi:hypothetical protein
MDGLTDELKIQTNLLVADHTNKVTKCSVGEVWFGFLFNQLRNVDEISHANEGCL